MPEQDTAPEMVHQITAELEPHITVISAPIPHPGNYRQGDVEVIAASMQRFGQVRPIVVQTSTGHVVAGNHTLKAAQSLGWTHIAAVAVDMDDSEAEAYLVADNRSSDKATNDDAALTVILERMMLAGRLEGTGYTPDDVDDMLAAMDALPEVEVAPTEAGNAVTDDELAQRFANRSQVALRQFVLMYEQGLEGEIVGMRQKLERAWGVSGMAPVVLEALRRATAEPPVEGLTAEETERANAPVAEEGAEAPESGASAPATADPEPEPAGEPVSAPPEESAANLGERADAAFEEAVLAEEQAQEETP